MANKDTTDNGVSDDLEASPIDRDNDITDIVANRKKARDMEEAGVDMNNPMEVNLAKQKIAEGEDPNPNAGKADTDDDPIIDPDLEAKNKENEPEPEPEKVPVKVNGVESMALKSDVDAEGGVVAYQKNRSADEKMRQAADIRKQNERDAALLKQRELDVAKQEQALLNKENNNDQSSSDAGQPSAEALALKDKMYSGDDTKTAEAIDTILERSKPSTPVDINAIVEQTAATVQRRNDIQKAKDDFAVKYKDIEDVPEYREYADQATKRIQVENPSWTVGQIINEAGDQARLKFREELRESQKLTQEKVEDDERLSNKRATDNVKSADAKVPKKTEKRAKTQSEIIAGMQASRSHATV